MITLDKIKTEWARLQVREQRLVGAAVIFILLLFFYFILIKPISDSLNTHLDTVVYQKKLLQWMEIHVPELQHLRGKNIHPQTIPSGNLLSSVEQSLKQSQLSEAVTTLEKKPDDTQHESVVLKFNKVGFDHLMTWLMQFQQAYNITVYQIMITRTRDTGIVQANLTLNLPNK